MQARAVGAKHKTGTLADVHGQSIMLMTPSQFLEYQAFAEQLADAAAKAILPYFRTDIPVEDKGGARFDPVTAADRQAEQAMRSMIRARYPEHGILGEEEGLHEGSCGLTWVLDPVDGTRAFICGLPLWGTLIALNDGCAPVLGVMNQPFTGERYLGTPQGAWRNGVPVRTRHCASLASATLMCTSPELFESPAQRAAFDALAAEARLLRFGGDCYAYCMLASGFVDVVMEAGLQPYDVQALIPVVEGAGGVMTSWDGGTAQHGGAVIACGDARLHADLMDRLRRYS